MRCSKCKDCEYKCEKCNEIAARHAQDQMMPDATLCWCCKNAVPKKDSDGKYIQGCAWSIAKKPVDGWEVSSVGNVYEELAEGETICKVKMKIYNVKRCPLFERG